MTLLTRDGCITCQTPFPHNSELASVPAARRVAFDPARKRVWRICEECGHWNLLGTEASEVSLSELAARYAAGLVQEFGGIGVSRVSGILTLVRVGNAAPGSISLPTETEPLIARDDVAALKRKRQLDRKTMIRIALGAYLCVAIGINHLQYGLLEMLGYSLWLSTWIPIATGLSFWLPLHYPNVFGQRYITKGVPHPALPRPELSKRMMITIALFAVASLYLRFFSIAPFHWYEYWMLFVPPASWIWRRFHPADLSERFLERARSKVQLTETLNSGEQLDLAIPAMGRITLAWSETEQSISLHDLPESRVLVGSDAQNVLRKLVQFYNRIGTPTLKQNVQALDLVRSVGGRRGILAALEGFKRDQDGRVGIQALPKTYQVAIDLVLAESTDLPKGLSELRHGAEDAAQIALEAEALDREIARPAM